jgi:hypothetical protein
MALDHATGASMANFPPSLYVFLCFRSFFGVGSVDEPRQPEPSRSLGIENLNAMKDFYLFCSAKNTQRQSFLYRKAAAIMGTTVCTFLPPCKIK